MYCSKFAKFSLMSFFLLMVLISLSVADDPPTACFTADVLTGDIPLVVTFVDASIGEITEWKWDFGDESPLSYVQNPTHTYTSYGTFYVTLTVYGTGGTSCATTEIVTYAPLVAGFSQNFLPGSLPLEVDFTDASTGDIIDWAWDFGDGSPICHEQNPSHTYVTAGDYCVTLTITDSCYDTSAATSVVPAPAVWTPNAQGHLVGPDNSWKVALVSAGFKSKDDGPDWHVIHRDKDSQDAYTTDPFTNPQWWDRTLVDPDDWPDGDAIDLAADPPTAEQPDDDQQYPICYTSGAKMKVKLTVKEQGITVQKCRGYQIESDGKKTEGGFEFPATAKKEGEFILECGKAFEANKVDYFEELTIMWEALVDGKWGKLVPSKNQCYVTLVDPVTAQTNKLFHTCLHVACEKAKGLSDENAIIAKIWENFSGRSIKRAEDVYVRPFASPAPTLKYYDPWNTSSLQTQTLLSSGNGQCRSWGKFFADVLKVNGFHESGEQNLLTLKPVGYTGMLIKNWDFASSPHYADVVAGYPYANINWKGDEGSKTSEMKHTWELMDVTDNTSGIPGQGPNSNPKSLFGNHVIVKYKNKYYDPSYGSPISSDIDTLETNSVAGYVMLSVVTVNEANIYDPSIQPPNPQTGYDVNHNGQIDSPTRPIYGIKQNPSGNQLQATDNEEY